MSTIGQRLDANQGVGAGFDTLRVLLAFSVVGWHCVPLTLGSQDQAMDNPGWVIVYAILPIFFALSGFLVTGSALRLTLVKFIVSRALRIVPALAVDTLFTILILGPLVTSYSIYQYFSHPQTYIYLLNIIGEIHFTLPGVFEANPLPDIVNGSLWTIPPELGCYLAISALILFRWVQRRDIVSLAAAAVFIVIVAASYLPETGFFDRDFLTSPGVRLVGFFLLGSACYLCRHSVPYSPLLFVAALAVLPIGAQLGDSDWVRHPLWIVITALPLTYIMLFLGVTSLPSLPVYSKGDYSYGIYLYGYPIQQTMVHYFHPLNAVELFILTMVPVTCLAMMSWHWVEKPTLRLRKLLSVGTLAKPVPAAG